MILRGLAAATCAALAFGCHAADAVDDAFVGSWTQDWPVGACNLSLVIRPDGTMTATDGANVVDSQVRIGGAPDANGLFRFERVRPRDNGLPACTRNRRLALDAHPAPGARPRVIDDRPASADVQAVLPFAHGNAIALCGGARLESCDHGFRRVPPERPGPDLRGRRDLAAVVERQFYALIPESPAAFELVEVEPMATMLFPDVDATQGSRPVACARGVGLAVVGHGVTPWRFNVATCPDAATIATLARKFLQFAPNASQMPPAGAPANRQGIGQSDETLPDGSELVYFFDLRTGIGWGQPHQVAVHIDARRRRAVVLYGVQLLMAAPPRAFEANPLAVDPAAVLKQLVVRIADDLDGAPGAGR